MEEDELCVSANSTHALFAQSEMSERICPARTVTEPTVVLTVDEKEKRANDDGSVQ